MKIYSTDKSKYIELIELDYDGLSFIEAKADFGTFKGSNDSISFELMEEFINDFDSYITDWSIKPVLTGTYDFKIEIYSKSNKTFIKATIGNTVCSPDWNENFGVYGQFQIEEEYLNQYLYEFKQLQD